MKEHWVPWDTGTHVDMLHAVWGELRGDRRPGGGSLPQRVGVQGEGKRPVEDQLARKQKSFPRLDWRTQQQAPPSHPHRSPSDAAPSAGFPNQVKK